MCSQILKSIDSLSNFRDNKIVLINTTVIIISSSDSCSSIYLYGLLQILIVLMIMLTISTISLARKLDCRRTLVSDCTFIFVQT